MDFLYKFIDSQIIGPNNVQIGLSVFSDYSITQTQYFLNAYPDKPPLLAASNFTYPNGKKTCISCGLQLATDECFVPANGDRADAQNIAILVTDGESNQNSTSNTLESDRLKAVTGKHIYILVISSYS
jgi:hypothetical protein